MTGQRGETWGFSETNLLLDVWADAKIQAEFDDCPKRNIKIFQTIVEKVKAVKPSFDRTPFDCRAKIKRLKIKYFQEKRKCKKSGEGKSSFPFMEKFNNVMGSRPIVDRVASLNSMETRSINSSENEGKYLLFISLNIRTCIERALHCVSFRSIFLANNSKNKKIRQSKLLTPS
jgi:hypothetical protein